MNRCLHITIQENAGTLQPRATARLPARAGTDPGDDNVMPRIENPGDDNVMPRIENPDDDHVRPRLENPHHISYLSGAGGYRAAVVTTPADQDMAAPGKTTPHPFIGPRDYSGFVIVRMAPGIESTAETLWELAQEHKPKLAGLQAVLELRLEDKANGQKRKAQPTPPPKGTLVSKPLVELHGPLVKLHGDVEPVEMMAVEPKEEEAVEQEQWSRQKVLERIHELEKITANTAFPPLHSLASYWRLDLRERSDLVEEVVARLNGLAEVDLAYRELAATDPQTAAIDGKDFAEDQGYFADAPVGIGAVWAWQSLSPSSTFNFNLCDLEQGWVLDHEDLKYLANLQPAYATLYGSNRDGDEPGSGHHGTAVLGILVATGLSALGVRGAVAGLDSLKVASHYKAKNDGTEFAGTNGHVAEAVAQALTQTGSGPLGKGDILLIEVQRGKLPAEVDEADFDAIRLAAGLGIIVIEAAGNGGFDLDAYSYPSTGRSLRRGDPRFRDSGAILVGASRASLPHDRAAFSNYGSRLDCFGWGEAVTTCGYGNLAGTKAKDSYTNTFSGTSSAAAIITGAAALLQSLHKIQAGVLLGPQAMREILAAPSTGTSQGPKVHGNIGVMPDLKAIVRDRLRLVADVYLRRSIGDDGTPPAPEDEISSSPDLLISPGGLKTVTSLFGTGSPKENLAAPGEPVVPGGDIYLRLRNRGLGKGKVHVQLFASPAATLITPERWLLVSPPGVDIPLIPQGDILVVAGPVPWASPISPQAKAWSLLAILSELEESSSPDRPYFNGPGGMPPGPPYFDWAEYRAFLRGPGVAWRNTHRVDLTPGVTTPATLTFWIAGTPDRARHFDFEVIQRLPADTEVSSTLLPAALAAKLRQHQPWFNDEKAPLVLPKRPRMAIRGVELAAGMYAQAEFTVTFPGSPLPETGHSLAIRQLWRGEEVGRITWFFEPDS